MKKLLLTLLCLPMIGFGQNYPGTEVQLLLGKTLVVKEFIIDYNASIEGDTFFYNKYGYSDFYKNKKLTKTYKKDYLSYSKFEYLAGKRFNVANIQRYNKDYYILELENDDEIIYFKYDPKYSSNFVFIVEGGIKLPDEYYCKKIEEEIDKFTSVKSYIARVRNIKILKSVKENIYLTSIIMHQISYQVKSRNGVVLLLENGEKIEKPNSSIEVDVNDHGGHPYIHRTSFSLTDQEVKLLSENKLTDYRLGYVDGAFSPKDALNLMKTMKCIQSKQ